MNIPIFPNSSDDIHCLQACMKMVLKYYFPEKDFSFEQINELMGLGKRKLWSTPVQAVVVLDDLGLNVKCYASFNFEEYVENPMQYIKNNYNDWKTILNYLDVDLDVRFLKEAINRNLVENKLLMFDDIIKFFKENAIIIVILNINKFENKEGYLGHAVVITDIGEDYVEFHDPGLPPIPNRRIDKEKFIKAWYDKDTDRSAIIIFGKK
ncbi:MAG: hypothetical protein J7K26_02425 [Candidatus Aenigmarchaeota archaeon]|nr:hypothetical protein [Candidatus Aenigmarchaeota archaeon]